MPVRNSGLTGALLAGTVATAAGLNLAVMGLGRTEATTAPSTDEGVAVAPIAAEVELTSADVDPGRAAPVPVLAVGLSSSAQNAAPVTTATSPTSTGQSAASTEPSTVSPVPAPPARTAPTSPPTDRQPAPQTTAGPAATGSPPSTVPISTEYLTYEFEGVATIVVALHDGERLEFWSVSAEDGWAFLVEDRGPAKVKIKFRPTGGGDESEFELKFDDGRLTAKREY